MKIYLTLFLAAASFATPAMAQDSSPFSGFRVEGLVGYDRQKFEDVGASGVSYGLGLGYDFALGNSVLGIEAEASESSVGECAEDVGVAGDELCLDAKRDLYVGARFGFAAGESALLYAKAGYTNARYSLDYDDGGTGANDLSISGNADGFRIGAGAEVKLGTNAYAKAEYRYSDYEAGLTRHQVVTGFGFRF